MLPSRPGLLFVITEDWYFWSHRLDLARAARDAGYDVSIATRVHDHGPRILAEGFRLLPLSLERSGRNPLREWRAVEELEDLYRRVKPQIVHHVALKPILYGTPAARRARVPHVVNAFAGLGYVFIPRRGAARVQQALILAALRRCLATKQAWALFQNQDDLNLLVRQGVVPRARTRIIRGSGVNLDAFPRQTLPAGESVVVLPSRMLWDKGIAEFAEAARILRRQGVRARFALVGRLDPENPAAIPQKTIEAWVREGAVEWWGHREDMPEVLGQATLVVLPSYREGLPKVLLEAAACGRPLVAADVPGCREIVEPGRNGLLVPARDAVSLARAMGRLIEDRRLCCILGDGARARVEADFGTNRIALETLGFYAELLGWENAAKSAGSRARA